MNKSQALTDWLLYFTFSFAATLLFPMPYKIVAGIVCLICLVMLVIIYFLPDRH